jgi:NitT/TauT family transport system permease protein
MEATMRPNSVAAGSGWAERLGRAVKGFLINPRWLALFLLLAGWEALAIYRNTRVIPRLERIYIEVVRIITTGLFIEHLYASMTRIVLGFIVAMILGTTIGILMGSRRTWDEFFKDTVLFGLALPGLIYALVAVMFFGLSILAPITAIVGTSYPFVAINIREGVRALNKDLLDMARAYRVRNWDIVRKVILPSLLPFVLAAIRVGFAIAWKVNTLVEVFGTVNGVGWQIRASFDSYSVHGMIAWALLFGAVMLVIEYWILVPTERYLARWRPNVGQVI